jgi:hypothetical protein
MFSKLHDPGVDMHCTGRRVGSVTLTMSPNRISSELLLRRIPPFLPLVPTKKSFLTNKLAILMRWFFDSLSAVAASPIVMECPSSIASNMSSLIA